MKEATKFTNISNSKTMKQLLKQPGLLHFNNIFPIIYRDPLLSCTQDLGRKREKVVVDVWYVCSTALTCHWYHMYLWVMELSCGCVISLWWSYHSTFLRTGKVVCSMGVSPIQFSHGFDSRKVSAVWASPPSSFNVSQWWCILCRISLLTTFSFCFFLFFFVCVMLS